tara:strand:- start:116 stop:541 length:426 start_codon:yes stop_codon:yes gene_type:complete
MGYTNTEGSTYTDYELNNYNYKCVYCYKCGVEIDFHKGKLHKNQEQGEEYTNDGSLVPIYSFTCDDCYGFVPYHGNTSLSLIDIERKVDEIQKNLDNLQETIQKTLDTVKKQNNTNSKIFSFIKIVFVTFIAPFILLMTFT